MQAPPPPEPLYVLRGHQAAVLCVAFLPGCSTLAAGDGEGELKLWDLDSRRVTASIRAHESHSGILQVACPASSSPCIVSQGRDGVVKCWELHSGSSLSSQPVQTLAAGSYNFCRFALLQQGQQSSSCSATGQQHLNARSSTAQHLRPTVVEGFRLPRADVAPAESEHPQHSSTRSGLLSQQLASKTQQQQQQDLDLLSGDTETTDVAAAAAAAGLSGLNLTDVADLTEEAEEHLMQRPGAAAAAAAHEPDCAAADSTANSGPCLLALPAEDAADVGVWQLGQQGSSSSSKPVVLLQQQRSQERPKHGLSMAVALVQPQGSPLHAVSGYEDGSVALWDTRQPSQPLASAKLHSEAVMCLAVAPNCTSGFSGSADEHLTVFKLSIPKGQLALSQQLSLSHPGIADVAVRPDARIAATAGWDGRVRVWHARKPQPLALLRWHSQQVACVQFSANCRLLAAGGRDNHISMWSIYPPDEQ